MDNSLPCMYCQQPNLADAVYCATCGTSLLEVETHRLSETDIQRNGTYRGPQTWGKPFLEAPQPLILNIAEQHLTIPLQDEVIVGRHGFGTNGPQPTIDLSYFKAEAKGVSRHHLLITRRETLVYVTDLNSSNGTWLNDQRMERYSERLLRDGDQLRLGQLEMRITFGAKSDTIADSRLRYNA